MSWQLKFRPEVEQELADASAWYEMRQPGLGSEFIEEIIRVWDALAENPFLHSRRHPTKNLRWRYPARFPYRVIYEVSEAEHFVVVAAVIHAARQDPLKNWE
jgi:plasmid stabilization system protein ParE